MPDPEHQRTLTVIGAVVLAGLDLPGPTGTSWAVLFELTAPVPTKVALTRMGGLSE